MGTMGGGGRGACPSVAPLSHLGGWALGGGQAGAGSMHHQNPGRTPALAYGRQQPVSRTSQPRYWAPRRCRLAVGPHKACRKLGTRHHLGHHLMHRLINRLMHRLMHRLMQRLRHRLRSDLRSHLRFHLP